MSINDISFNGGTVKRYRRGGELVPVTIRMGEVPRRLISPPKCDVRLYIYSKADIIPNLIYHVD